MKMLKNIRLPIARNDGNSRCGCQRQKSGRRKAVVETAAKDTTVDSEKQQPQAVRIRNYSDAETVRGLVILHKVKSKYYMELPIRSWTNAAGRPRIGHQQQPGHHWDTDAH